MKGAASFLVCGRSGGSEKLLLEDFLLFYLPSITSAAELYRPVTAVIPDSIIERLSDGAFIGSARERACHLSSEILANLHYLAEDGMTAQVRLYNEFLRMIDLSMDFMAGQFPFPSSGCEIMLQLQRNVEPALILKARCAFGRRFKGIVAGVQAHADSIIPLLQPGEYLTEGCKEGRIEFISHSGAHLQKSCLRIQQFIESKASGDAATAQHVDVFELDFIQLLRLSLDAERAFPWISEAAPLSVILSI